MDRATRRGLDAQRRTLGPIENNLIDEWMSGAISRRMFVRGASIIGLSVPAVGLLSACGTGSASTSAAGVLRIGALTPPNGEVNPYALRNRADAVPMSVVGEYLFRTRKDGGLEPELAVEWSPNDDATVWRIKLRPDVTFHDGSPMTAADVIGSLKRFADPKLSSAGANAGLHDLISPEGLSAEGDLMVVCRLNSPSGTFPSILSSGSYWPIIHRADYKAGTFVSTPQGTGPYVFKSYDPSSGASYTRNNHYWGGKVPASGVEMTFFADDSSASTAMLDGQIDILPNIVYSNATALLKAKDLKVQSVPSTENRWLSFRCDRPPFDDVRVRQAVAYAIDRQALVDTLLGGYASIGNDSPIAPGYPAYDSTVPQRQRDLDRARSLLADAGQSDLTFEWSTTPDYELLKLAQLAQQQLREVGITTTINVQPASVFYEEPDPFDNYAAAMVYGSPRPNIDGWLRYGYVSGTNRSKYSNPKLDTLVKQLTAAVDIESQRRVCREIQLTCLDDTPAVMPYFPDKLAMTSKAVDGYDVRPENVVDLRNTSVKR